MCTFQLKVDKVAIKVTFGTPKAISKPGLYVRMPWPLQKLVKLDKRKQLTLIDDRETLTQDDINLIIQTMVAWSVSEGDENALKFYKAVGETSEDAEKQLQSLIISKQDIVIRGHDLGDFLNASSGANKNEQIEEEIRKAVNSVSEAQYGITIHKVSITRLNLHEKNSVSVLEKMRQGQLKKAEETRSIALKESEIKKNAADEAADKRVAEAEAAAREIRGEVVAKSSDLFKDYQQEQEFISFLRKLDAIKQSTKDDTTFFINSDIEPFDIFKADNDKNESNKND